MSDVSIFLDKWLWPKSRIDDEVAKVLGRVYLKTLPRFVCADGFSVSIQAGELVYSTPRDNTGPYVSVELGFPSEPVIEIGPYAEDIDAGATDTVYPFVPTILVATMLEKHGGPSEETKQLLEERLRPFRPVLKPSPLVRVQRKINV